MQNILESLKKRTKRDYRLEAERSITSLYLPQKKDVNSSSSLYFFVESENQPPA